MRPVIKFLKLLTLSIFTVSFTSCNSGSSNVSQNNDDQEDDYISCSEEDHCKAFVTRSEYNGNLGGISGADSKCMADANYPGTGKYKAMLASASRVPQPGSQTDWVLKASTEYRRLDETVIGTTLSDSTFSSPLTNSFASTGSYFTWTGTLIDWSLSSTCSNWSSDSVVDHGEVGDTATTSSLAWTYGATSQCHQTSAIICVQQ